MFKTHKTHKNTQKHMFNTHMKTNKNIHVFLYVLQNKLNIYE